MILLNLLKGATVFMSVVALVGLSAGLIELWVQRQQEKDPDYRLALSVLKWLSIAGWFVCAMLMTNYVFRFFTGLTGSSLPGPTVNSIVSLASFVATYSFFAMIAVVLLYLLWESDDPTDEERQRRRRIAERRAILEQRRRQRRVGDRRVRRGV
jgi:membrane protein implicated in regulation of membrane protease activity